MQLKIYIFYLIWHPLDTVWLRQNRQWDYLIEKWPFMTLAILNSPAPPWLNIIFHALQFWRGFWNVNTDSGQHQNSWTHDRKRAWTLLFPVSCGLLQPAVVQLSVQIAILGWNSWEEGNSGVQGNIPIPWGTWPVSGSASIQKAGLCYSLDGALAAPPPPHSQMNSHWKLPLAWILLGSYWTKKEQI